MAAQIDDLPPAPTRTDAPAVFVPKSNAMIAALQKFVDQTNVVANEAEDNALTSEANKNLTSADVTSASTSAAESAQSATLSASSANLKGRWGDFTGAALAGEAYAHVNKFWALLQNIPAIESDEPSDTAPNWQVTNDVNMTKTSLTDLNNPQCHILAPNDIEKTLSGTLTRERLSGATYIDDYGKLIYSPSPSTTNFCVRSEQADDGAWFKDNLTVDANQAVSPDGRVSSDEISRTSAGLSRLQQGGITITGGATYTISCWFTGDGNESFIFGGFEAGGGSIQQSVIITPTETPTRFQLTFIADDLTTSFSFQPFRDEGDTTTQAFRWWGAQLEESRIAGGYLKTLASSVTGTSYFGIDALRVNKKGALIEGASTNYLVYSEIFDNVWSKNGATVGINGLIEAPNGAINGNIITATVDGNSDLRLNLPAGMPEGTVPVTLSTFAKAGDNTCLTLSIRDTSNASNSGTARFNLIQGTIYDSDVSGNAILGQPKIIPCVNGWYRCSVTVKLSESQVSTIINPTTSELVTTSLTGSTLYVWGGQLEESSTSYIPTLASPATRANDVVRTSCRDNVPFGAFSVSFEVTDASTKTPFPNILEWDSSPEDFRIEYRESDNAPLVRDSAGVYVIVGEAQASPNGKYAVTLDESGNTNLYRDGLLVGSGVGAINTTDPDGLLRIYGNVQGHLKNLSFQSRALTPDEVKIL